MELDNFKYNLSKLKKCDQYWDEMPSVLGGRHCSKCDKKIVDFSSMTFSDIAIYMSESIEPVCGFYRPEQLEQTKVSKNQIPIVIGLTTLLTASTVSKAEIIYNQTEQKVIDNKAVNDERTEQSSLEVKYIDTVYVIGNIQTYDTTKKMNVPIPYATVIIKGTKSGVLTMDNGDFSLRYIPTVDTGNFYLTISSIGFQTKEIEVNFNKQANIDLGVIKLNQVEVIEFWVTTKKRSKWNRFWRKITKPFRRH